MRTLSVIGIGKLGTPLIACLAAKGYFVIGADTDPVKTEALNRGETAISETGLNELLTKHSPSVRGTLDIGEAVRESDLTFIIVPTPSNDTGEFSLDYVLSACESIGLALRRKSSYHVVVLTSTVMPGATESAVVAALEASSGRRCGKDFGLCYSPEFIALGSVVHDLLYPDFVLIGESDTRAGDVLTALYQTLCVSNPPIFRSNFVNAELAKIAVNTYVTTKISYANMLSEICEGLPGADVDVVTKALGLDSRIGKKYLKGATGYGGPCFPRDNVAFARLARRLGGRALLAEATDMVNREQVGRIIKLITAYAPPDAVVGVLGLSYKPETDVVTESQGVMLSQELVRAGFRVLVYDPMAVENARGILGASVCFALSETACASEADVLVITTPWRQFKNLGLGTKELVVIDCWRMLNSSELGPLVTYVALGVGKIQPQEERRHE